MVRRNRPGKAVRRIYRGAMNKFGRREFLGFGAGLLASSFTSFAAGEDRQQWYQKEVSGSRLLDLPIMEGFKPTEIMVEVGARQPFEMLHFSDSHLVHLDVGDLMKSDVRDLAHYRERLKGFGHPQNMIMFAAALAYAKAKKLHVLHTGDLLDIVSDGGLANLKRDLADVDCIYAIGNHEYCSGRKRPPRTGWLASARRKMQEYLPNPVAVSSKTVGGVNFVTVDNVGMSSDVFAEQFAAIEAEFAKNLPVVLACHIPFYTPDLADMVVAESKKKAWSRNLLKSVQDLSRGWLAACPGKNDLEINLKLSEWLRRQKNLKAILCGHTHFEHQTWFSENVREIIAGAGFKGMAYHIKFV